MMGDVLRRGLRQSAAASFLAPRRTGLLVPIGRQMTAAIGTQCRGIGSISAFDSIIFRNLFGTDEIRSVSGLYQPCLPHEVCLR
jgi:hypothetical protein